MPQRYLEKKFLSKIGSLEKTELQQLLLNVRHKFEAEPKLLRLQQSKIMFVGDSHGNFELTQNIINEFHNNACDKLVFLGDYLDRGEDVIENINFLFHLKIEFPDTIYMLRGNHETPRINANYGFYDKVIRFYGSAGQEMYSLYNYVFSKMPLAGITWNGVFFVHAGIPEKLDRVDAIDQIEDEIDPQDSRTFELLWNDPKEDISGFKRNSRGPRSKYFGEDVFNNFLKRNNIQQIIRSHEHFAKGYNYFFNKRLLSIVTTKNFFQRHRPMAAILSRDGNLQLCEV